MKLSVKLGGDGEKVKKLDDKIRTIKARYKAQLDDLNGTVPQTDRLLESHELAIDDGSGQPVRPTNIML